jgi:hypothetical protein
VISDKWLDEEPNTVIVIKVGQKSSTFAREEHRKRIRRKNWRKGYLRDLDVDGKTNLRYELLMAVSVKVTVF